MSSSTSPHRCRTSTRSTAGTSMSGSSRVPPPEAATSSYNLADFMLGLRSTYALSNILIADLRQNMHFAYLQDDVRVTGRLTLNLGVRYEYATPWVEKNNVLSNFDPATRQMVIASDGSLEDRSTIRPDRNNFGPRLGFAYTLTAGDRGPRRVRQELRALSPCGRRRTCCRSTDRRSSPPSSCQSNPLDPAFRRTEQGYPTDLTDPSQFNPLTANITYMPNDYHSSEVQSWFVSVQRELGRNMLLDVAYVGNRARRPAAVRELQPGRAQQRRRFDSAAGAPADSGVRRHHVLVQRRQVALSRAPGQVRLADARRPLAAHRAHAVAREGQRGRLAREPERQLPRAAGLPQPGGGLRLCPVTTSRTTARPASRGSCRSMAPSSADGRLRASTASTAASRSPSSTTRRRRFRCPASSRTSGARTTTGPT